MLECQLVATILLGTLNDYELEADEGRLATVAHLDRSGNRASVGRVNARNISPLTNA